MRASRDGPYPDLGHVVPRRLQDRERGEGLVLAFGYHYERADVLREVGRGHPVSRPGDPSRDVEVALGRYREDAFRLFARKLGDGDQLAGVVRRDREHPRRALEGYDQLASEAAEGLGGDRDPLWLQALA